MQSPAHIQKASDSGSSRVRKRPAIQADLEIGQPGDKYEQEADTVAQRVMMQPSMDEEEAVQMQPAAEEEELQMQAVEEEELQMQAFGEEEELQMEQMDGEEESVQMEEAEEEEMLQMADEEEEFLQAKPMVQAKDGGGMKASPELASKISSTQGTGSPLEPGIQREMGGKMGADFSGVNIHTGSDASAMSSEIGARAFTVGNDIYFNRGQYDPHSSSGKHLLAHELTHTVQQGGSVRRDKIQMEGGEEDDQVAGPPVDPTTLPLSDGTMNSSANQITFENVEVPGFKLGFHRGSLYSNHSPLKRMAGYSDNKRPAFTTYFNNFVNSINTDNLKNKLRIKLGPDWTNDEATYVFKLPTGGGGTGANNNPFFFGSLEDVANSLKRPNFVKRGNRYEFRPPRELNIDHIVELQVANWDDERWANNADNLELLDSEANQASKNVITGSIHSRVDRFNQVTNNFYTRGATDLSGRRKAIKDHFRLVFNTAVSSDQGPGSLEEHEFWDRGQIIDGEPAEALQPGHISELDRPGVVRVFSRSGTIPKTFQWETGAENQITPEEIKWIDPFIIINKHFDPAGDGSLLGLLTVAPGNDFFEDTKSRASVPHFLIPVNRLQGAVSVGEIDREQAAANANRFFSSIDFNSFSPLRLDFIDYEADGSLVVEGKIVANLPLIEGQEINFIISEGAIEIFKEFQIGDFAVPAPLHVEDSSIRVFYSTSDGLGVDGNLSFGINQVGQGNVTASLSTSGGFELAGMFNFDSELFQPAEINVEYKDETWTIGGQIGIPEGKVRGVKSATINATYSEGNFAATGEAELDIPGIERGTMEVNYGEEGFSIGGAFDLSSDIPGIQSGRVEATVSKESGDEEYSVSVAGTAQPDIPGVDSTLSIAYNDGAITIEGTAGYSRGMLSGTVRLGATNRAIDDNGQPEGEPDDTMRVYGGGSLTLQLTPWLEATAGVTFLPNGEMEVQGRIGLPGTVDVFPRRQIRRNLFTAPTIEIPLFAIPLGPRSIGLVAQIGGGLDFEAGFGPGQLRELYAEVTYNPDREDETTLHGRGVFAIPADAGLTLRGDLGLGVSVAIASLSGGIELAGTLGLEGEALASVDVNWSPQTGIALDAEGRVTVNPKFAFNLNAFARATLGIGWFSVSETWRHRLAGFEWGPDIQFGIVFPVHYREGEPFDLSFDDIEVIYPELDIPNMAKGLARDVKDDLF